MADSVFTKIIKGELPARKVYEDNQTLAILTIEPETAGHLLVIPKKQVDKFYEMTNEEFADLMTTTKKIAIGLEKASGLRTILKIIGTDVAHVHVHLIPLRDGKNKLAGKNLDEIRAAIERKLK